MNSYSGAKSFAAEYVSKNGGPYRNPTAAQAAVRGTAADEPGETTRYSLGAIPMTLKNVQYGRVTTQLDLDAGEKGYTDNFIRNPYAKKGDEDSADNYFYRGTNATTIEQMAALPSDQKAVYKGHALMYGIDNNYHASGGRKMLETAADALAHYRQPPLLIAVTVLTSLGDNELREIGIDEPLAAHVARLTALAAGSGLNGVVCSAHEAGAVKAAHGRDFLTVTPGIRPAGSSADDQTRTMTPAAALQAGSDYLVIGRPVTRAEKPAVALADIIASIAKGE